MVSNFDHSCAKNATNSAQRILQEAELLFAQCGFEGTRVDEIAKMAGINKRMIYHHYGSKEGLYQAVLEKNLMPILQLSNELLKEDLHPAQMYERLLNKYFDFLSEHRVYVRLVGWEVCSEGNHLQTIALRRQAFDQVVDYFELAQHRGQMRPDLCPRALVTVGITLCFTYFAQMRFIQGFSPEDLECPEQHRDWKRSVLALILKGSGLTDG